jgi:hypothetical protein
MVCLRQRSVRRRWWRRKLVGETPRVSRDQPLRYFRPSLMTVLEESLLIFDERQPVALALDRAGSFKSVASWAHHPPPSQDFQPGRRRTVVVSHESVRVVDGQGEAATAISHHGQTLNVTMDNSGVTGKEAHHTASLFQPIRRISEAGVQWTFTTLFDGPRVASLVTRVTSTGKVRLWNLGPGSATDAVVLEETPYVCIRRAHRRPWEFEPTSEVWRIVDDEPTRIDTLIDISRHCWPLRPYAEQDLTCAFGRAAEDARLVVACGATDVKIVVEDVERMPRLQLLFSMPNGKSYARSDHPFDELGSTTGGLAALGIILAEDVEAGLPSACDWSYGRIRI